jgi:hypothetical protein
LVPRTFEIPAIKIFKKPKIAKSSLFLKHKHLLEENQNPFSKYNICLVPRTFEIPAIKYKKISNSTKFTFSKTQTPSQRTKLIKY